MTTNNTPTKCCADCMGYDTSLVFCENCPCHTPVSPTDRNILAYGGGGNTPTDWESEFDRIPHGAPLSARGDYISVVNAKSFLTEKIAQARREGYEAGQGSGENRILTCMRHVGYDSKPVVALRREWDKLAAAHAAKEV